MTTNRGQGGVFLLILALVVGIIAFVGIYSMSPSQNMQLAETIVESVDVQQPEIEDLYMETVEHAVKRHGPIVYDVVNFCNPHGNAQMKMHWESPKGPRDAWICFFPGDNQWWITITGDEISGDNVVTAFPREAAKTLDDVVKYLLKNGYTQ